jgi:hypothetical protein
MRLKKRVEAVELVQARRNGNLNFKIIVLANGENEAQMRTGLADSTGPIIFISEIDAKL